MPPHGHAVSKRGLWLAFLAGLLITGLLTGVKVLLEHSRFGRQVEHMTLVLQQLRLGEAVRGRTPGVTVVDISDLPLVPAGGARRDLITSRRELTEIVRAISASNPAAIGIDVIFGSDEAGTMLSEDTAFLDMARTLTDGGGRRVPVFVAIFDSVVRGPQRWLGDERFGELAAYTLVPNPEPHSATTTMIGGVDLTVEGRQIRCVSSRFSTRRINSGARIRRSRQFV